MFFLPIADAATSSQRQPSPNVAEQYLLVAVNQERAARGLPQLQNDPLLAHAARLHALQMARYNSISHQFPGELDLAERGAQAGVRFSKISENVALGRDASALHEIWMHSPKHRANLLDPHVNVIGVAVVARDGQFYGVEDFGALVLATPYNSQESAVAQLLAQRGLSVGPANRTATLSEARQTCTMETGYAGQYKPWFVMRYTASRLDRLPEQLESRIQSGRYHRAVVGACSVDNGSFTAYNIAVLLYLK
ncbi:CAP domain-containing protein [Edaphobacter albus]|uniref:CAP domain-containing protein n=1 Tax=Edaphobacter sp. 4G125 TaxID=2763071 RepID=UPI0021036063|nr:CAP domain-containing protein [Edaphobacter sp. 4G125]